jgi:hypothetical protein
VLTIYIYIYIYLFIYTTWRNIKRLGILPHILFTRLMFCWEYVLFISLYNINRAVCKMATDCVLCEKWTELLCYLDQVQCSKFNTKSIPIYLSQCGFCLQHYTLPNKKNKILIIILLLVVTVVAVVVVTILILVTVVVYFFKNNECIFYKLCLSTRRSS